MTGSLERLVRILHGFCLRTHPQRVLLLYGFSLALSMLGFGEVNQTEVASSRDVVGCIPERIRVMPYVRVQVQLMCRESSDQG